MHATFSCSIVFWNLFLKHKRKVLVQIFSPFVACLYLSVILFFFWKKVTFFLLVTIFFGISHFITYAPFFEIWNFFLLNVFHFNSQNFYWLSTFSKQMKYFDPNTLPLLSRFFTMNFFRDGYIFTSNVVRLYILFNRFFLNV